MRQASPPSGHAAIVAANRRAVKSLRKKLRDTPLTDAAARLPADKPPREGQVRDHFHMPHEDYALITVLKKRARNVGVPDARKSELLRAALRFLADAPSEELRRMIDNVRACTQDA